jgi:hypothetical protein
VFGQRLFGGLGDAKVDDFRLRLPIDVGDQDVGRLEVTVDDAATVRVLYASTDSRKQGKPIGGRESLAIAVRGDPVAVDLNPREIR